MPEEIHKSALAEVLKTVRLKRSSGTILEASSMAGIMDCCRDIRSEDAYAAGLLSQFFNLAAQIADPKFPIQVEFAIKLK